MRVLVIKWESGDGTLKVNGKNENDENIVDFCGERTPFSTSVYKVHVECYKG